MRRNNILRLAVCALAFTCRPLAGAYGQISPGELSAAHSSLEGIGNCTACHVLGKAVEGGRCLQCHVELAKRVTLGKGYHATVRSQSCVQCHKEHHGRDFALIRWKEKSFDHGLAGFELAGKHRTLECRACHNPARIAEGAVVGSQATASDKTYLGLSRACGSCHRDPHAGLLGAQCTKCHSNEFWKPAEGFSHDRARFPLSGKHRAVGCEFCHGRPGVPGKPVRYTGLAFRSCADCHNDPHAGRFKQPCQGCHSTEGWEGAGRKFDHAQTRFPLRGRHATVSCERCHPVSGGTRKVRFAVARFSRCVDCHSSPHGRQFASREDPERCSSCHNEQSWRLANIQGFDHARTRFPLRGRHESAPCAICHVPQRRYPATVGKVDGTSFAECTACHVDVHRGQFLGRADGGRCESCHREAGFRPSTYLKPAHAGARFPLEGSHEAVPCDRCHTLSTVRGGEVRLFRWENVPRCEACHRDVHRGEFASLRVQGCISCHGMQDWRAMHYDHSRTDFRLDGKHRFVLCERCHRTGVARDAAWRFRGTPVQCAGCHAGERRGLN